MLQKLQRELEALASTLVMKPLQPRSWPLFEAVDLVWRVPAVMLFLLFMGKGGGGEEVSAGVWLFRRSAQVFAA